MKTLHLTSAVVIVLLSFNVNSTNYKFIPIDKNVETKICVFAGNNNKHELKKALRKSSWSSAKFNQWYSANNITCNGMVMAHFSHKYDALDTFLYLNRLTIEKDKIPATSIEIKDIAAVFNRKNEETKIIYVGSAK